MPPFRRSSYASGVLLPASPPATELRRQSRRSKAAYHFGRDEELGLELSVCGRRAGAALARCSRSGPRRGTALGFAGAEGGAGWGASCGACAGGAGCVRAGRGDGAEGGACDAGAAVAAAWWWRDGAGGPSGQARDRELLGDVVPAVSHRDADARSTVAAVPQPRPHRPRRLGRSRRPAATARPLCRSARAHLSRPARRGPQIGAGVARDRTAGDVHRAPGRPRRRHGLRGARMEQRGDAGIAGAHASACAGTTSGAPNWRVVLRRAIRWHRS